MIAPPSSELAIFLSWATVNLRSSRARILVPTRRFDGRLSSRRAEGVELLLMIRLSRNSKGIWERPNLDILRQKKFSRGESRLPLFLRLTTYPQSVQFAPC